MLGPKERSDLHARATQHFTRMHQPSIDARGMRDEAHLSAQKREHMRVATRDAVTGIILSGGNVDAGVFAQAMAA